MATTPTNGGVADAVGAGATQSPGASAAAPQQVDLVGGFVRDVCAVVIPALYGYLKAHAPTHEQLVPAVGQLTLATQRHAAGDYASALWLVYTVHGYIAMVRAQRPELPAVKLAA